MGDGWETKRSRQKGHKDWAIIKLYAPDPRSHPTLIDVNYAIHSVAMPGIYLTLRSTRLTSWGTSRSLARYTP